MRGCHLRPSGYATTKLRLTLLLLLDSNCIAIFSHLFVSRVCIWLVQVRLDGHLSIFYTSSACHCLPTGIQTSVSVQDTTRRPSFTYMRAFAERVNGSPI